MKPTAPFHSDIIEDNAPLNSTLSNNIEDYPLGPNGRRPFSHNIEDYPKGIVLCVNKPYKWTSADVIRKVKWLACRHFGKKNLKVGHAGTLDPLATGVLLVCIGNATKRAEELQRQDKEYIAGVSFGATTPSYDLEKDIDRTFATDAITEEGIIDSLKKFVGEQEQIAPLFSAKSVDGVRAYEIARKLYKKGEVLTDRTELLDSHAAELIRTAHIRIDSLELLSFDRNGNTRYAPPMTPDYSGMSEEEIQRAKDKDSRINVADISNLHLPVAEIRIRCSKGTYIRALARDLGESLDNGAFMSYLTRTESGGHRIEDALSISELTSLFR